jgi:hypothetical protein
MGAGGKGQLMGRVPLLKAARGGSRGRQKRWAGATGEAMGGQGGSCGPIAASTAAPLFGPCG